MLVFCWVMKGVDNGFPPGKQREQTAAWMFLCSLQTNIQATESWSLLISLGVIDITCPLQYSTPPPTHTHTHTLSNFSKDQHSSSQKVIWSTSAFNKSTNVQPCVYSPHVKNIRQRKRGSITESAGLGRLSAPFNERGRLRSQTSVVGSDLQFFPCEMEFESLAGMTRISNIFWVFIPTFLL